MNGACGRSSRRADCCGAQSPGPSCAGCWPTYHQVGWPDVPVRYRDGDELPVWLDPVGGYVDPATGEVLPTWDEALDAISQYDLPWHVARSGERFDAQGVLAGSLQASRCIGYLTKYLTKQVSDCHQVTAGAQHDHAARLAEALRFQPCSPRYANWLRYGIQPKNTRPGLAPGRCEGNAMTLITSVTPGGGCWCPQVVRQDPGRPPRRPQGLAAADARCFGNRPGPVRLGARCAVRPGSHGPRSADAACRR
jgi:replication initiator protein RepSA